MQLQIDFTAPYQAHSHTSRQAATEIEPTSGSLRELVYRLLAENGPLTDEQIAAQLGMNPSTQRPRRIELVKAGRVVQAGWERTKSGRKANRWAVA